MKSEYYGNSRYFYKEGITLYHFKCQTYGNYEHIISKVIIDHVLYYFMSYSSDKYAANTAAQIKLWWKNFWRKKILFLNQAQYGEAHMVALNNTAVQQNFSNYLVLWINLIL